MWSFVLISVGALPAGGTIKASQPGQIIISVSFYMEPLDKFFSIIQNIVVGKECGTIYATSTTCLLRELTLTLSFFE